MPRQANDTEGARIQIRSSAEVAAYLADLAQLGIHGKTASEVAKTLLGYEVERLIREGFIQLRRPRAAS